MRAAIVFFKSNMIINISGCQCCNIDMDPDNFWFVFFPGLFYRHGFEKMSSSPSVLFCTYILSAVSDPDFHLFTRSLIHLLD